MTDGAESLTLANVSGPQAPAVVAAVGLAIGKAVLDETFVGPLRPVDVGLDDDGHPLLDRAPAAPIDADPSLDGRGLHDVDEALYGLGQMLTVLATGRPHGADATRGGQAVPVELQRALDLLLDANPMARRAGVAALSDSAGPLPDLRLLARRAPSSAPTSRVGEVRYTTTPTTKNTASKATGSTARTLLVIPADEAASLNPAQRTLAAGLAGVPRSSVDDAIGRGASLTVASGDLHEAQRDAAALDLPVQVLERPGALRPVVGAGLGAVGGVLVLAALAVAALSLIAAGVVAALGVFALVLAAWMWMPWLAQTREFSAAKDAWSALGEQRALQQHPLTGSARALVTAIARELPASDLPELAQVDLREGLRDLEARLTALEAAWNTDTDEDADHDALQIEAARILAGLQELERLMSSEDEQGAEAAMDRVLDIARMAAASRELDGPG